MKPAKPLYGAPCNGCGLCCLMEQCRLSERAFGPHDRCPALIDMGNRFACGLIAQPDRFFAPGREVEGARFAGELLGVGTYCDAVESDADWAIAGIMDAARGS